MIKKLSIITINRNNASSLRKTLESVVSQTFTDFEYIVIDGASTDGSVDVIEEYAHRINYWVSEPDSGIYNAMNKGILMSKGEYLLFLNSGDWLHNANTLKRVFSLKYEADIITGNMLKMNADGSCILDRGQAFLRKTKNQSLSFYDMYYGTVNHSCSFIKKRLFEQYGLYDESYKIVSDWIFFLVVIGINRVMVKYVDVTISCFDMLGISNKNESLLIEERKAVLKQLLPEYIIEDYKYLCDLDVKYKDLQSKYDYIFHYKITLKIAEYVNVSIRFFRNLVFHIVRIDKVR